jgi:tripartite ATP-independent transporter DctP family solute receptor
MGRLMEELRPNRRFTRRRLIRLAAGAGAALGGGTLLAGCGRDTATIHIGDTVTEDNPEVISEKFFGKRLAELTGGAYDVKVFPGGVLGGHSSMNEQLHNGTLEMAKTNIANLNAFDARLSFFSLPYAFPTRERLFEAQDGPAGRAYAGVLREYDLELLAWFDSGARCIYNTKGPVRTPDDVKRLGLRMRAQPDPVQIATFNAFGAKAGPIDTNQVYSALQQGVIDAADNSIIFFVLSGQNEVAHYFSYTEHFFSVDVLLASSRWLRDQPARMRDAIVQTARETQAFERKAWQKAVAPKTKEAVKAGAHLNRCDRQAFETAAKPVWSQYRSTFGNLYQYLQEV